MGTLYVVATPIGNLEDITLRAIRTLGEVSLIAAEDTRKTRKLLTRYDIKTPLTSYNEVNKRAKLPFLVEHLAQSDVAMVSEAGMPGLSDPGYELIRAATASEIKVVPIPGPSAVLTALAVSGLPVHQFTYLGFLPRTHNGRKRMLALVSEETRTMIVLEAPHRLRESLSDISEVLGNRRVAVCRELTKLHEEVFRGRVSDAIDHFVRPRGEFTLVLAGNEGAAGGGKISKELEAEVESLCREGMWMKEAVACVATASGVSKRLLYDRCKYIKVSKQEESECAADVFR